MRRGVLQQKLCSKLDGGGSTSGGKNIRKQVVTIYYVVRCLLCIFLLLCILLGYRF